MLVEYFPTEGENSPCRTVLEKALALEGKLGAQDERLLSEHSDVIIWFMEKYRQQQNL